MAIKDLGPVRTVELISTPPPLPAKYQRIESFNGLHWKLDAEFPDKRKVPGTALSVTITMFPGIAPREKRDMMKQAEALLPAPARSIRGNPKGARPALPWNKEDMLNCAFQVVGPPTARQSQAKAVAAIHAYMQRHDKPVSRSTVQKRYRQWLDAQKHPKKKYVPERSLPF